MKDMINNEQKYPISQKVKVDANVMKKLMEDLERGQKSTQMIRNFILQQNYSSSFVKLEDYLIALDHHSMVALHTYANSLAMLKGCDFVEDRKASDQLKATSFEGPCKSQVFANQIFPTYTKRRKIGGKSKEKEVTHVTDDGFVWRKYGQKMIHDCLHPRHYYRCTHKDELKCEATKQIQQISENPTKYKLIYNNNHTCKKKTSSSSSPYIINNDSIDEYSSSAIVLSFDGSSTMNTILFQEATTHDHTTSISEETKQMNPMIITKTSEASSSSNAASEQSDEHTSMQVVEINNNQSSTSCSVNFDEDYQSFMAEFCELFPDWWTPF